MTEGEEIEDLIRAERKEEAAALADIEHAIVFGAPDRAVGHANDLGLSEQVPGILHRLWNSGQITEDTLRHALPEVWIHNKWPLSCLGERSWLKMFKATGFVCRVLTTPGIRSAYPMDFAEERPPGPLTVWRGAYLSKRGRGLSWSLHRECAVQFADAAANRDGRAALYRVTVPSAAVLGMFADAREQEVVVNPDFLRGRVEVDREVEATPESVQRRALLAGLFDNGASPTTR